VRVYILRPMPQRISSGDSRHRLFRGWWIGKHKPTYQEPFLAVRWTMEFIERAPPRSRRQGRDLEPLARWGLGYPIDIGCADPRSQTRDLGHPSVCFRVISPSTCRRQVRMPEMTKECDPALRCHRKSDGRIPRGVPAWRNAPGPACPRKDVRGRRVIPRRAGSLAG
jgi:hypothetical protein